MLLEIKTDEDLKNNFDIAIARINKKLIDILSDRADAQPTNCKEPAKKLSKLLNDSTLNIENKRQVIEAILTILKSKPFWEKITIESKENLPEEYLLSPKEYKDNLMLNIAKFYSGECEQSSETSYRYHICQWIRYLHNFCA